MLNRIRLSVAVGVMCFAVGNLTNAQTHDHAAMNATNGEFNPYVVSDDHGGFFMAYVDRKDGVSNVLLQHSLANGAFANPIRVSRQAGDAAVRNENPPKLALGPNSEVFVVWASERERWKGNIRFARSLNGGKTFEPPIDLNSDSAQPPVSRAFESIVVDRNGRIFVAWIDERNKTAKDRGAEIWMATSEDRGKTFSHDQKILSNVCECCRTALAIDSAGRIYLSYRLVPAAGPMLRDIAVARSDDGGKTFKPSIVHHDGWELNACPIDGATMTIDAADHVHVIWFTQTGDLPRLYIASSTDDGVSFGKPDVLDASQKLAKHAHVVATGRDQLLVAWDDVNGGPLVKWGAFDASKRSLRILGSQPKASYPIIAASTAETVIVALQPEAPSVFRKIVALNR
jgi:hypothetical protein